MSAIISQRTGNRGSGVDPEGGRGGLEESYSSTPAKRTGQDVADVGDDATSREHRRLRRRSRRPIDSCVDGVARTPACTRRSSLPAARRVEIERETRSVLGMHDLIFQSPRLGDRGPLVGRRDAQNRKYRHRVLYYDPGTSFTL